jgi:hypothetical protein
VLENIESVYASPVSLVHSPHLTKANPMQPTSSLPSPQVGSPERKERTASKSSVYALAALCRRLCRSSQYSLQRTSVLGANLDRSEISKLRDSGDE